MSLATIVPVVILVVLAAFLLVLAPRRRAPRDLAAQEKLWAQAKASEDNRLGALLLAVAKPMSRAVEVDPQTNLYRTLSTKLLGTGTGMFAGSVEVFVSVQVAAILLASALVASAPLLSIHGLMLAVVITLAVGLVAFPYNRVSEASTKRLEKVRQELPEFAEMLLMPVTSGYGIIPALDFTSARLDGVVSAQVRMMLELLAARAGSEAQIFEMTGQSLGDPAAVTFFNTLLQSYTDGVQVSELIRSQAEQLRHQEYQRKRAALKKLPNKLVLITALHLMPFLFIVAFVPTLFMLGGM